MKDKGKANKLYIQEQEHADGDDSWLTSIFWFKISKICKKGGFQQKEGRGGAHLRTVKITSEGGGSAKCGQGSFKPAIKRPLVNV